MPALLERAEDVEVLTGEVVGEHLPVPVRTREIAPVARELVPLGRGGASEPRRIRVANPIGPDLETLALSAGGVLIAAVAVYAAVQLALSALALLLPILSAVALLIVGALVVLGIGAAAMHGGECRCPTCGR